MMQLRLAAMRHRRSQQQRVAAMLPRRLQQQRRLQRQAVTLQRWQRYRMVATLRMLQKRIRLGMILQRMTHTALLLHSWLLALRRGADGIDGGAQMVA
jgi:hypothetical protein